MEYKDEETEMINKSREYYECRLFANTMDKVQSSSVKDMTMGAYYKRGSVFGLSNGKFNSCRGYFYRQGVL